MKLFIRPRYRVNNDDTEVFLGYVICSTNYELLVDEQVKEHFPPEATGKEMKAEFPSAEWGNALRSS